MPTTPPKGIDLLLSPSLLVDLDRVRHNLACMQTLLGDFDRWRPHLKTTKLPRVWRLLLDAGIRHVKVATTREARVFLELTHELHIADADLLIAYPHQGPALHEIAALAAAHPSTRISILSEHPEHATSLPHNLGLFIDINTGMDRTGVPTSNLPHILAIAAAAGERLRGLHGYEGHVHGGTSESRTTACHAALSRLLEVQQALEAAGHVLDEVVTSGTPSFYPALTFEGLRGHRVSPGTVVFHDARSARYAELSTLLPAARVLTRVISHPRPGRFTCDAGSKALAAETGDPCVLIDGAPDWQAHTPSEEHLPVELPEGAEPPALGTPLLLIPQHVCPTVNLAEMAMFVEGGSVVGSALVSARAHDAWTLP